MQKNIAQIREHKRRLIKRANNRATSKNINHAMCKLLSDEQTYKKTRKQDKKNNHA